MKKRVWLILLSVLFVWITYSQEYQRPRSGFVDCGRGSSPNGVISRDVAIKLAEDDAKRKVISQFSDALYEDFYISDFHDGEYWDDLYTDYEFYMMTIWDLSKKSAFYNFETSYFVVEEYEDEDGREYKAGVVVSLSFKNTLSLILNAAELKYEYAYGKPVPESTKEIVNKSLERWLK